MKGFKYDKFKAEITGGDSWGSYSDLFMVLSFVFLMMYVVSSLRSGTNSIQERLEKQKIARDNDDLRAQMKAYDTLKDQALKQESEDEQEVYGELMDKLSLLQEQAKDEKNNLRKQALENEKKEMALNKYQQVVRNIINANMLAKNKLKVREEIIDRKNETIVDLRDEISEKKEEIANNNQQILRINRELAKNIENLTKAHTSQKMTKKNAYEQIERLKRMSQKQIEQLNQENKQAQMQVAQIAQELSQSHQKIAQTENVNKELNRELETTTEKLEETENQINNLQRSHAQRMAEERAAFERKLKSVDLTAKEKTKQLEEFNRKAKEKDSAMSKQIASLKQDLNETQARETAKTTENQQLTKSLAEAQKRADARAKLSKEIAKALKEAGVDADVNGQTGDVTISFGKDFFDNGSSKLKNTMADVLKKFVPKYSESLFKDPKIASKITSVEIVGFASPTYGGKYIDPLSLNPLDQKAAKYNLDLSFKRARSIFDYMFDTGKVKYANQKQLLSLVKVSGRSFFAEGRAPAGVTPGMDQKEFCKTVDCKQAQKVIIKFNMDDKK